MLNILPTHKHIYNTETCSMLSCFGYVRLFATPVPQALSGDFPTQGSNPRLLCLPHCRQILYYWSTREAQDIYTFQKKRTVSQSLVILYNFFDLPPCQLSINTWYFSESIAFYFIEVTRHLKRLLYWKFT